MIISSNIESSLNFISIELQNNKKPFKIFFGSSFLEDKKDDKLFSQISQIVDCVENGINCILIDL
jgi:hypothetical protein